MRRPVDHGRSRRMAAADRIWLGLDSPGNPMVVTAVLEFAGPVDERVLRRVLAERLLAAYPRFGQRVVPGRWPVRAPRWRDTEVDLDYHLQRRAGDRPLSVLVQDTLAEALDLTRPPWRCHLASTPTGDALVVRLHHCIADGIALAAVLLALTDAEPDRSGPDPGVRAVPAPARPAAGAALRQGVAIVTSGLRLLTLPRESALPLTGRPREERRVAWGSPAPFSEVRAMAAAAGSSVNDVLLAVTAGALRRYLLTGGHPVRDLRAYIPVNVRGSAPAAGADLGNRLGLLFPRLPVAEPELTARIAAVARRMTTLKAGGDAGATAGLVRLVGMMPRWAHRFAGWVLGIKGTAVVTNVPGPRRAIQLAGAEVSRLTFWVPQIGSVGVGISILSYAGTVSIGVATDIARLPDPARLAAAFDAEFADLRLALGR